MNTYQIVPEERSHITRWIIQVVENGKVVPGGLSNEYDTREDAQYWLNRMIEQDRHSSVT